jgi:hypothetical protein
MHTRQLLSPSRTNRGTFDEEVLLFMSGYLYTIRKTAT